MTQTLFSLALAVRTGPRPRHVQHVHKNGSARALCGVGPVVFIGDALDIDCVLGWPLCAKCRPFLDDEDLECWGFALT